MLGLILPWWWRWAAFGLALLAAASFGAVKMHEHDRIAYDALQARFTAFEDRVRSLGLQAKKDALAKEAADEKRRKDANAENATALATLAGDIARLRHERDTNRSAIPERPAASKCPDGQACFDRAELEQTLRRYRSGVRQLVDEGSEVTVDLNTAKRWAKGRE